MNWKEQITIPNILTLIRLACIPGMAKEIYDSGGYSKLSAVLFQAIWFTDILDGWIARHFNQVSDLGKVLDPLVDKIFQITTGIMMCVVGRLPLWVPVIMVIKELIMIIGGAFLSKREYVVSAKWYGKLTTVLTAIAFVIIFFLPKEKVWITPYLFILPIGMTLFSLVSYGRDAIRVYRSGILDDKA